MDTTFLYRFISEERKNALKWREEFSDTIELNWATKFIMIYFNKFPTMERNLFYKTLETEIPKILLQRWDKRGTLLKDEIIDYTINISHEIPTEEVANIVKYLVILGCSLGSVASDINIRKYYGY